MGEIESAILAAWRTVRPRLDADANELAQRLARRTKPLLTRPPRPWCLALRASDRRLPAPPVQHSSFSIQHDSPPTASPHEITLTSQLLRRLTAPIHLDGRTPHDQVAEQLGTTSVGLRSARIKNVFTARHIPHLAGRCGKPVPLLSTDRALDPSARLFAAPDPAWSSTATSLASRLPDGFAVTLTRITHFRAHTARHEYDEHRHPEIDAAPPPPARRRLPPPEVDIMAWYKWSRPGVEGATHFLGTDPSNWRKSADDLGHRPPRDLVRRKQKPKPKPPRSAGSLHFNGHLWLCPACGKTCRTIFYPLPPLNLLDLPDPTDRCSSAPHSSFRIQHSALSVPIPRPIDGFACRRCHRVKFLSRLQDEAWNDLIAYLTAGLLYGREVPRPAWFTKDRKTAYKPRPTSAPSRRRPQVMELLLQGLSYAEIGKQLGLSERTINDYAGKIYAQHNVGGRNARADLARKLGQPPPAAWTTKLEQVRQHLAAGLSRRGNRREDGHQETCGAEPSIAAKKIRNRHGCRDNSRRESKACVTSKSEVTHALTRKTEHADAQSPAACTTKREQVRHLRAKGLSVPEIAHAWVSRRTPCTTTSRCCARLALSRRRN